ncbi:MAG: DUF4199 domain-containing protein [Planctomycetota bacterium]
MTTKAAVVGGLAIGVVNLAWLYIAFWVGLHTSGIAVFQIYMLIWLALNVLLYVAFLWAAKKTLDSFGYWRGVGIGANAAVLSGLVAVLAQIGYFTIVNPEWPEYLTESARQFFQEQGLAEEEIELKVEQTRLTTTVTNYSLQSLLSETLLGVILSMITMIFLRDRTGKAKSTDSKN